MNPTRLHAAHLRLAHGSTVVLELDELELLPGELHAVVGVNAVGKSTLLRALAGLGTRRDAITVHDRDQTRSLPTLSARERARLIAYLPQNPSAAPGFTAHELVGLAVTDSRRRAADATAALARVGIADLAARDTAAVSGGQLQLVHLARVLAQHTPILLLDEPTAALDLGRGHRMLSLLRAVAHEGRAVGVVVHDLTLALGYCDRVTVLAGGARVATGRPDDVLTEALLTRLYGVPIHIERHLGGASITVDPAGVDLDVPAPNDLHPLIPQEQP